MKKALISGITGQDGSYLAELLLEKGYEVHGIIRRSSSFNTGRIEHLYHDSHEKNVRLKLHYGDLTDGTRLEKLVDMIQPDEVYNLAAQSHVRVSFDIPEYTVDSGAMGTMRFLEAIRNVGAIQKIRFYQASSSEMYGKVLQVPQNEETPFYPRSPYACGKVFSHFQVINYRESYGMHASNGILFNHESPRRGETFVTRKITMAAAKIKLGKQRKLSLGNLDAQRDWGHAADYVEAMWLMLQQPTGDDYVVATNETYTVRDFLKVVFDYAGLGDYNQYVVIDQRLFRPNEVPFLKGNPAKAISRLGWKPKHSMESLAKSMFDEDLKLLTEKVSI